MSYRDLVLPSTAWHRLVDTDLPLAHLPADGSLVVVTIETEAAAADVKSPIIARWIAGNAVMLEGLWIAATHRKRPGVARRLLHRMLGELRDRKVHAVITLSQTPEVDAMAERAGFVRVPGTIWQKDLR